MKIAVEGCAHGELDNIYNALENIQRRDNVKIDLLICCGDFQAVRNEADLACMAVPQKYKNMCSFYKYYNGEKTAPILTIFIGGNHEASNHLWELPFGGWVAPNIYYLGYSGVVNFGGLRIAGLSGIYKSHDYGKGHYESPPFDKNTLRSIYHVRSLDVFKLKLLTTPVDIGLSHDWPKGVYHYGNLDELYRWKGFLREDIESNTLGSYGAQEVLRVLQPDFWFSAHLHCRFPAQVFHSQTGKVTNFLALDKCLPRRKYLEVIDVGEPRGPLELSYDAEWLAITKSTLPLLNTEPVHTKLPHQECIVATLKPNEAAIKEVTELFDGDLKIPENFTQTAPLYDPAKHKKHVQVTASQNPQTDAFCRRLKITHTFWATDFLSDVTSDNPDAISLSDDDDDDTQSNDLSGKLEIGKHEEVSSENPDEISSSDSRGSRLASWLPAPILHTGSGNETSSEETLNSENSDEISVTGEKESETQSNEKTGQGNQNGNFQKAESLETEPTRKKFKLVRRNQDMYSTTEENSDD